MRRSPRFAAQSRSLPRPCYAQDVTADGIGILIAMILGFCGLFWRQSAWSSHVDERIDDLRTDLGGRMNRIENRLDAFLDRRGAN